MKLALLLYFPRSGSTFFASQVARHFSQVLVIPELRLPALLVKHDVASSANPRRLLLDLVKRDHQFPELQMSMAEVEHCIDQMGDDYSAEGFLLQIARFIAQRKQVEPKLVIYKCGAAGRFWSELRQRMPDIGLIHVYRDPRATVNSAMHTERPYHPGQKMGRGDPWFQAEAWNAYSSHMQQAEQDGELLAQVCYETLCQTPLQVMQQLAETLGLSSIDHSGSGLSVSAREESIHANADKAAMPERSAAWQLEMPRWHGLVVEYLTAEQMHLREYADYFCARGSRLGRLLGLSYGYAFHLLTRIRFRLRRNRARASASA